jgi:hypothetical protein
MKKELRCTDCKKVILGAFKVYDGNLCKDCYYKPVHPELNRHKLFSGNKKEFWANRASWNESSIETNKLVIANHPIAAPVRSLEPFCDPLIKKVVKVPTIKVKPHTWY